MTAINKITAEDVSMFRRSRRMNDYQLIAQKSAIYPGQGTFMGLMYVNAKLNGEAGEFSEKVGKALRDDGIIFKQEIDYSDFQATFSFSEISEERKKALILELGDVLWYVAAACRELGIFLEDIAAENLEKLASRTERQALQGDGDNR